MKRALMKVDSAADLAGRYGRTWWHFWRHRAALDSPARLRHELEFLPAALSLQETPVSPLPRVAAWLLVSLCAAALGWACFFSLDVTATAMGKVVAYVGTQTVQPLEAGVVTALRVREGDKVQAGQVLVELDGTAARADDQRLQDQRLEARLKEARGRALAQSVLQHRLVPLGFADRSADARKVVEAESMLRSDFDEYLAKQTRLDAELERIGAETRTLNEGIASLERTLPIVERRARDLRELVAQNYVSQHGYMEREQERLQKVGELTTLRSRLGELQASRVGVDRQKREHSAEARRVAMAMVNEGRQQSQATEQDLVKAQSRLGYMVLTAPRAGSVMQVAVTTVGGVVTPAQVLMYVVPEDGALEVEATVENKDIGFIRVGQQADVRVDTYQFTRYGSISGEVTSISRDALFDDKRGLLYKIRVRLARKHLERAGQRYDIAPGMSVSVDLAIGRRRVYEFFLDNFLQKSYQSLRER